MSDSGGFTLSDAGSEPVVELIKRLQRGELSGKQLRIEDRRACVGYLTAEGYSSAEIGGILRVADRTVIRDRKAVRQANALTVDEGFAPEMAGRLVHEAESTVSRLRRISREKSTPAAVRVDAERTTWQVLQGLVGSLQKLGYLPTATQQVSADLTHTIRDERPMRFDEIEMEIARIESVAGAGGLAPESLTELNEVRQETRKLALTERVRSLAEGLDRDATGEDTHEDE